MNTLNWFSTPDFGSFAGPHCLPYFNNLGPNSHAPQPRAQHKPITQTLEPYVTGTSILGIKYKDGVMLAGDTLASYGSLARFRDVRRIRPVGKYTLIGATGEYSDFQEIVHILDDLTTNDDITDDGSALFPNSIHSYLTRVMYGKRNKMDPLYAQMVVAGYRNGSFLGLVDLRGTNYEDDTIATGYGGHIARPLLRKAFKPDMSREEAKLLLESCLTVLYYRDARAFDRIQYATITAEGTFISEPYELVTDWSVGNITYGDGVKHSEYKTDDNNNKVAKF